MNRSLVSSVLDGSEESERIFIYDTARCNGRAVLKFGLCELIKRSDSVYVVLCDISQEHWVKGLPIHVTSKLTIHSYMQDTSVHVFMTMVLTTLNACQGTTALVIDSLSSLLLFLHPPPMPCAAHSAPTPAVCQWLFSMQQHHILALLHSDLHEESTISQMNYIATCSVRVTPASSTIPNSNDYAGIVHTTHKRLSGKILKQTETYSIAPNCISMETMNIIAPTLSAVTDEVDPAANLTFDLHLSTQEKMARSQVILPYTSAQLGEGLVGVAGSGQIFYQPDEMDDFDDSDPDDDLEF